MNIHDIAETVTFSDHSLLMPGCIALLCILLVALAVYYLHGEDEGIILTTSSAILAGGSLVITLLYITQTPHLIAEATIEQVNDTYGFNADVHNGQAFLNGQQTIRVTYEDQLYMISVTSDGNVIVVDSEKQLVNPDDLAE